MQNVLITGGTGLIGKRLTRHLTAGGYQVTILTRKLPGPAEANSGVNYATWNVPGGFIDLDAIEKADIIIHLAGAGVVDKKWTKAYKEEIIRSRTESSALLVNTLRNNPHSVKTVISASAIGWYGEDPPPSNNGFEETEEAAEGFLGETCKQWEASISPMESLALRLVKIRTGIVLSNEGGALPEFKKLIRFGLAGILSDGKQVVSWIHIDDLCRLYIEALKNEGWRGVYNGVAPTPVTNKELTLQLARQLKGNFFIALHVPKFVLRWVLGERSVEVLKSCSVSAGKARDAGFQFLYPTIEAALHQLTAG
jgi:uncharacterized protein (TIGR01777 family)